MVATAIALLSAVGIVLHVTHESRLAVLPQDDQVVDGPATPPTTVEPAGEVREAITAVLADESSPVPRFATGHAMSVYCEALIWVVEHEDEKWRLRALDKLRLILVDVRENDQKVWADGRVVNVSLNQQMYRSVLTNVVSRAQVAKLPDRGKCLMELFDSFRPASIGKDPENPWWAVEALAGRTGDIRPPTRSPSLESQPAMLAWGDVLFTLCVDGSIVSWDAQSAKLMVTAPTTPGQVAAVCSSGIDHLEWAGSDRRLRQVDTRSGATHIQSRIGTDASAMTWIADTGSIVVGSQDGSLSLVSAEHGESRRLNVGCGAVRGCGSVPHSPMVIVAVDAVLGSPPSKLLFLNTDTWAIDAEVPMGTGEPGPVVLSPDGKIAAIGYSNRVELLSMSSRTIDRRIEFDSVTVKAIAFSPDGKQIAAAGEGDDAVKVYDTEQKRVVYVYHGAVAGVRCLAWSPGGTRICAAGFDDLLYVWEIAGEDKQRP